MTDSELAALDRVTLKEGGGDLHVVGPLTSSSSPADRSAVPLVRTTPSEGFEAVIAKCLYFARR